MSICERKGEDGDRIDELGILILGITESFFTPASYSEPAEG